MINQRNLGAQGLTVSALGLGCMGMSASYGSSEERDEKEAIATLHRALDIGITFLDTAEVYGQHPTDTWYLFPTPDYRNYKLNGNQLPLNLAVGASGMMGAFTAINSPGGVVSAVRDRSAILRPVRPPSRSPGHCARRRRPRC